MRVSLNSTIRSAVPATVNGQVWLDRSTTQTFATSSTFLEALREFAPGSLRGPTTGHNNLPRSHPMNSRHTYKFGDFSTATAGNLWEPARAWQTDSGPISEITGPVPFSDVHDYLHGLGYNVRIHYFLDWQSGYSEGLDLNGVGGPGGDYQWYRNPEPVDIDGNAINPVTAAAMTALEHKKLENRRIVKYLKSRGYTNIILNVGGEDWRGWSDVQAEVPWQLPDEDDQNIKYTWLSNSRTVFVNDIAAFILERGFSDISLCTGFLESTEGGRDFPLNANQISRNRTHLQYDLTNYGSKLSFVGCSMHYRGEFSRWLSEPEMQYSFPTDTGQGSWTDCSQWLRTFCTTGGNNYPNIRLFPFANSVGDSASTTLIDPLTNKHVNIQLTDHERGLVGTQMMIELIKSDLEIAQMFPGVAGDNENAGFGAEEGLCGNVNGSFVKFPLYHALKTFGPVLQRTPDVLSVEASAEGVSLVQLVLKWVNDAGNTVLSTWLINKLGTDRSVTITVPEAPVISIATVMRFSAGELSNPVTMDAASVDGLNVSVEMLAYSTVYLELELVESAVNTLLVGQSIGGDKRHWLHVTTQDEDTVTARGYFTEEDGMRVGDTVDVILTNSLEPSQRTRAERLKLVISGSA